MWKNYLKIAARNLIKSPFFSTVNICGLSLSIAISLLMILWVHDEWSYDRFHENNERIGRLYMGFFDSNKNIDPNPDVSYPLAVASMEQIPEVERVAVLRQPSQGNISFDDRSLNITSIDATFDLFEMFTFDVLAGSMAKAEENVDGVILTRDLAERLFGTYWSEKAVGKAIKWENDRSLVVEAVIENIPAQSTLQFDMLSNFNKKDANERIGDDWGNHNFKAYVLLGENADWKKVEDKITEIYAASMAYDEGEFVILHPLSKEYLYTQFDNAGNAVGGRIDYVQTFFLAALFLLFIACANFINMATSRASLRAKEVGVRKTIGASQTSLVFQFMTEALLVSSLSIVLAVFIAELSLPQINEWTGKQLFFPYSKLQFWLTGIAVVVIVTILAGAYPSFFMSSFKVISTFQQKLNAQKTPVSLRQALVIGQFALSMLLMVGAVIVQQQVNYLKNKNLGLDRENTIYIDMSQSTQQKYKVLKEELENQPGIASVTSTSGNPLSLDINTNGVSWDGKQEDQWHIHFNVLLAEHNFAEFFDIKLESGRFLDPQLSSDSSAILINQKTVEVTGLQEPLEGQTISLWERDYQVIGVVKNFHTASLYKEIPPMVMALDQGFNWSMFVKTQAGQTETAVASLLSVFEKVMPDQSPQYEFLDENYANTYRSEQLTSSLAKYFAAFSIFISCLGLFGLGTFIAERKAKEISIRKVLGATISSIVNLLSASFLRLIIIALLISIPFSWYMSKIWLSKFAYHTEIQVGVFLIASGAIILISFLTIGIHSLKAALVDPVSLLKDE